MGKIIKWIFIIIIIGGIFWMGSITYTVNKYYNNDEISKSAFDLINKERIENGRHALFWSDELFQKAKTHSIHMATVDKLEHSNMPYGENIAMGATGSGQTLYEAWRDSPLHRANYLSDNYTVGAIGIGFKLDNIKIGEWNITYNISRGYATFLAQ